MQTDVKKMSSYQTFQPSVSTPAVAANNSRVLDHHRDEMIHAWIGFAIVSIIVNGILPDLPFLGLITLILLINAISKTVHYSKYKKMIYYNQTQLSPQPTMERQYPHPAAATFTTSAIPKTIIIPQQDGGKFCSMCGNKHIPDARFCAVCGHSLQ